MIFSKNIDESSCYKVFDRYNLIKPTTHPHGPSVTLHINSNLKNTEADVNEAPPQIATP